MGTGTPPGMIPACVQARSESAGDSSGTKRTFSVTNSPSLWTDAAENRHPGPASGATGNAKKDRFFACTCRVATLKWDGWDRKCDDTDRIRDEADSHSRPALVPSGLSATNRSNIGCLSHWLLC